MKRKVLIAGAGQLGSRYLQGLSKAIEPLDIHVFDLSAEPLTRAEQRWNEMQPVSKHETHFLLR
jgi:saccharopine dehydrogenase-like NADP-dependent oxidoreductase